MRSRWFMLSCMAWAGAMVWTAGIWAGENQAKKSSSSGPPQPKYKVHFDHVRVHQFEVDLKKKREDKKGITQAEEAMEKAFKAHQSLFDLNKVEDRLVVDAAINGGMVVEMENVKALENPMKIAADLGIWAIVIFVLLLFILRKMAWGPMLEGLKKREETIRAAVEEAKHARAETEKVTAEFKAKMDRAYAEIPKIMEEARRDAQVMVEEMKSKAQAEIQSEKQRLRREVETARDQALKEMQEYAANLATLISAKFLQRNVTANDHRRFLNEAMVDVAKVAKEKH